MKRRAGGLVIALGLGAGFSAAQEPTPRTSWGHPDLQGTWTNATLTPLQRPVELGDKEFFTPEELAQFAEQRLAATNADRPLRPGDVGSYNDVFFERGAGGVHTGRTSLVIEPRDGRIPALTPAAQAAVDARTAHMAAHPADRPSDRWLTAEPLRRRLAQRRQRRKFARRGALHAHGRGYDHVSSHDRRSPDFREPVDRRGSAAHERRPDLRGGVPRRESGACEHTFRASSRRARSSRPLTRWR